MNDRRSLGARRVKDSAAALVRKHRSDYRIVLYMGLLMMLGLIVMYAIGPQRAQVLNSSYGTDFYTATYFFGKQALSLMLALVAFVVVSKIPISWWQTNAKRLFIGAVVASAILAIGGWLGMGFVQCSLGACRWFVLGELGTLQPAEFMKFGLLLFGASFIAYRAKQGVLNDMYKSIIPLVGILLVVAVFVIGFQEDMGTGLVMLSMMAGMLLVGGINARVGAAMLAGLVGLGLFMIVIAPHRIARITTFLQGDTVNTNDAGAYHIAHAKIAIGSGGFSGVGIGNSVQATGYLPEAINDSVFAIMGETFGFIGLFLVLVLFGALLLNLLTAAGRLSGLTEKLIVVGVFSWLAAHVALNVAAMTGIFPLTGITLPLLSFGGTSMIFIAGALGLAFQLSSLTRHTSITEGARYEDSHGRRGLGGHVTPVAAVCSELKRLAPEAEIRFWCDRRFYQQAFATMVAVDGHIMVEPIIAGKLRRFYGVPLIRQLIQVRAIVLPNLIDALKLTAGTFQSLYKMILWRPDVVFSKGGFVCLPVGIAARILRIPLVIHDSDAHPGLTSRILSRWAVTIATGAPLKHYTYPNAKSHYVGIPVARTAKPYTVADQRRVKQELGFSEHEPLIVITGGGLGAATLNDASVTVMDDLLSFASVALVAGRTNVEDIRKKLHKRSALQVHGYLSPDAMQRLLGAADIVVSRAGATTLLELAALAKPSVIVPHAHLTGGHQLKNAAVYKKAKAIILLNDAQVKAEPSSLVSILDSTLLDKALMKQLSHNIRTFSKPDAAKQMARLILKAAQ